MWKVSWKHEKEVSLLCSLGHEIMLTSTNTFTQRLKMSLWSVNTQTHVPKNHPSLAHQSSAHLSRRENTNYHFMCINNTPRSFFFSLNWWLGVVECACYKETAHLLPSMPNTSLTGWRPGWVSCNRWQTANVGSTLSMLKHAMVWHRLLSHERESAPKSNKLQITATKATKTCFPF